MGVNDYGTSVMLGLDWGKQIVMSNVFLIDYFIGAGYGAGSGGWYNGFGGGAGEGGGAFYGSVGFNIGFLTK